MDSDQAIWLAELLVEAVSDLQDRPGLTIEAEGNVGHWVQVLFDESDGALAGFILNFPCRGHAGDPLTVLAGVGLMPPPGTEIVEWEANGFAAIRVRPDVPVVALAHFIGDVLVSLSGMVSGTPLTVQIEYGF